RREHADPVELICARRRRDPVHSHPLTDVVGPRLNDGDRVARRCVGASCECNENNEGKYGAADSCSHTAFLLWPPRAGDVTPWARSTHSANSRVVALDMLRPNK